MNRRWVVSSLRILFLVVFSFGGVHKAEAQRDILGEVRTIRKQISGTFNARVSVPKGLDTSLGEAVARGFSGDIAERYDTFYNASFDYLRYGQKAARYAEEFAEKDDIENATKYLDKANRYVKMSQHAWAGASEQLDGAYSIASDVVVYEAAKTALGFAVGGVGGRLVMDGVSLYTDYLLDKELRGVDEAKKNLIKGALVKVFLNVPIDTIGGKSFSEAINKGVTKTIGGSGLYSYLDRLIGNPKFQKEFLRIVADGLAYTAEREAEWLMEKLFETPVAKRAGYRSIFDTTVPKDTKNLLYKVANFDASKTIKSTFTKVEPYLPTTTKALAGGKANELDATGSVASLQPNFNVLESTLASPNFSDNFSAGLGNWSHSNAYTGSNFGPLISPDGSVFGIIHTGLGDPANTGLLSKQFNLSVPLDLNIGFQYNFVTNEYPVFVGSIYNDSFTSELHTPDGSTINLAGETVNSSSFTSVSGLPTDVLDFSTGGETGWKTISTTVSTPAGTSELHFHVKDVGDNVYDSATLIDNVSVK